MKIKLTLLLAMIAIASFLITYAITFYYGVQRVKLQTKLIQNELLPGLIQINHAENKTKIIINTRNIQTLYPIAAQVAKKINFSIEFLLYFQNVLFIYVYFMYVLCMC